MSVENLKIKAAVIEEIKEKLEKAESAVVVDYIGTTVEQANALRKNLREAGVDYTVYKNTLMAKAVEGTKYEDLKNVFSGPSALAISYDDATAPARVLAKSIKDFGKRAFKGGVVEGTYYDAAGMELIANIPSRDELISKFLGSIQSPITNFARVIKQIAESKEA